MRKFTYAIILSSISLLTSFTFGACGSSNAGNEDAAQIEAAMMMGRDEARHLVNRKWKDTVELQNYILEARAKQSELVMQGRMQSAAAFDSAFVTTVKAVHPELASKIFPEGHLSK